MSTDTPPPYFPQGSLSPPDPARYRRFKLIVAALIVAALFALGGLAAGALYVLRAFF
jgi:hypothetical protein